MNLVLPQELWIDDDLNNLLAGKLARPASVFIGERRYGRSSFHI